MFGHFLYSFRVGGYHLEFFGTPSSLQNFAASFVDRIFFFLCSTLIILLFGGGGRRYL